MPTDVSATLRMRSIGQSLSWVPPAATTPRIASCNPVLLPLRLRSSTSASKQNIGATPIFAAPTRRALETAVGRLRQSLRHIADELVPNLGRGQMAGLHASYRHFDLMFCDGEDLRGPPSPSVRSGCGSYCHVIRCCCSAGIASNTAPNSLQKRRGGALKASWRSGRKARTCPACVAPIG